MGSKSKNKLAKKTDIKTDFLNIFKNTHSGDSALNELMKDIWPRFRDPDPEVRKKARPEVEERVHKLLIAYELDSQYALGQTHQKNYSYLVVGFCKSLIKEYECKTPSEKALAEMAASGFVRYLQVAQKLDAELASTGISSLRNTYIGLLSKELDRALRTYIAALNTLRQIKNPLSKIKVEASAAFIANNQQVNAISNKENNDVK